MIALGDINSIFAVVGIITLKRVFMLVNLFFNIKALKERKQRQNSNLGRSLTRYNI